VRLAIFSDIHANLPALEAVLEDIGASGVDETYALGDLVGYAPWSIPRRAQRYFTASHMTSNVPRQVSSPPGFRRCSRVSYARRAATTLSSTRRRTSEQASV
jgi:hypothetical protein